MSRLTLLASVSAPAAGAPLEQVFIASVFAAVTTAVLLSLVMRHRSGRSNVLANVGAAAGRLLGMEPWAALPFATGVGALVSGAFGVFWDISLHVDVGRDPGPLANPAHYFILLALYGIFASGLVSCALHERAERPSPVAVSLPFGISVPVGGGLLLVCGAFALTGFPLDDFWHRMFGQDVTLWGPTHLVMINGAILSVPVLAVLALESRRARRVASVVVGGGASSRAEVIVRTLLPAALLFAISFWAAEFDWGIPQYRVVWHPLLLALASSLALTTARIVLGRGGALRVVLLYLVLRGATEAAVGLLGESVPAMPPFVVEALLVEALGWRRGSVERAPVRFGALAGLLCGTVGFAAQYGWTHVWGPVPWTPSLLAEGLPTAVLAGIAGGGLGALLGTGMVLRLPPRPVRRRVGIAAAVTLVAVGANALWTHNPTGVRAAVQLTPVPGAAHREAYVTARISDPRMARDAELLQVLSWQGGGRIVRHLHEIAPGVWRTDGPVPLSGDWKTLLRLQSGRAFLAMPLELPDEPAIPKPGVHRPARFTAAFATDVAVMQTERRNYVPGWLWTPAALAMLAFCGLFVLGIAVGLARVADDEQERAGAAPTRPAPARRGRRPWPRATPARSG